MKNKLYIIAAASVAAIAICVLVLRDRNRALPVANVSVVHTTKQTATKVNMASVSNQVSVPVVDLAKRTEKKELHDRINKFTQKFETMGFSVDIFLLAKQHPELGMTVEQIKQVQGIYDETQIARLALEGSLAKVASIKNDEIHVVIPAYPEEGQKLRDTLYQSINQSVGAGLGDKIQRAMGVRIAVAMRSFGVNEQNIFATPEASDVLDIVHVTTNADGAMMTVNSRLSLKNLDQYTAFEELITPRR